MIGAKDRDCPLKRTDFKFETGPNAANSNAFSVFGIIERLNFEFGSDFDIRIPNCSGLQASLIAAVPA